MERDEIVMNIILELVEESGEGVAGEGLGV